MAKLPSIGNIVPNEIGAAAPDGQTGMSEKVRRSPGKSAVDEPRTVCVLAYDGLCTFEFGICVEVFGQERPEIPFPLYRIRTVSCDEGPLRALGGISLACDSGLEGLQDADLILVPGWKGINAPVPGALIDALRAAHARGARVASICSGIRVLAEVGLLSGRRATTHWRYAEAIRAEFPAIDLNPDVLFVDEGSVLTSAGSAAGIDLCLHIVRRDHGSEIANRVARRLVMPTYREGGQAQFIPLPVPQRRSGDLAGFLEILRKRLNEDWSVSRMSKEIAMSRRTLHRRFMLSTGHSPMEWLTIERIAHARHLLEVSGHSLPDIGDACGFRSVEIFRHHFSRLVGISPNGYRKGFAGNKKAALPGGL